MVWEKLLISASGSQTECQLDFMGLGTWIVDHLHNRTRIMLDKWILLQWVQLLLLCLCELWTMKWIGNHWSPWKQIIFKKRGKFYLLVLDLFQYFFLTVVNFFVCLQTSALVTWSSSVIAATPSQWSDHRWRLSWEQLGPTHHHMAVTLSPLCLIIRLSETSGMWISNVHH